MRNPSGLTAAAAARLVAVALLAGAATAAQAEPPKTITAADLTAERVGATIPVTAIGEPVSGANLLAPRWLDGPGGGHGEVDGELLPVDPAAKPIHFRVCLPAQWSGRAAQMGGSGFNGVIPFLAGYELAQGFVTYGSDSGHQAGPAVDWSTNDEVIRNFGYQQMKKTHDAAMVIIERVYGQRPRYTYYFGGSQGGREALTVAQRYPADYDGITADVPVVALSSLMLAPELIRIQEKPLGNWVTPAKTNAIRAEFMRQADGLDGLEDGIINNYQAARARFDLSQGDAKRNPWSALRGPDGRDPNPADTSTSAKLTDGQIATLGMVYSRYRFASPLANGAPTFGMWLPNTDPGGSGLIVGWRFRGQEGAEPNAPIHGHLGVLGVTGFLMGDPSANPLDYVEGGRWNARRAQLSAWLDSTNPDLSAFRARGGKMIVTIGTNDTLASPGAQLDYYQAVLDTMGREAVDSFARLLVLPQTGHGLSGQSHDTNGAGQAVPVVPIPNQFDRRGLLLAWVEQGQAPAKTLRVTAGGRSQLLCSYPNYPRYVSGPTDDAASYASTAP